jgi:pimeloyl-ACP methyl ester carboxylesterase
MVSLHRPILIGLGLAVAIAYSASTAGATAPRPTIVIEHGAWADGSSFAAVVRLLQDQGYTVDVPPVPLTGLASDSATLADFLKTVSGPIVLVGHSYGGMVITDAATGDPRVKALVYIDAFIPAQGESALELTSARPGSCLGGGGDPAKVFTFVPFPGAPSGDADLYVKTQADGPFPGFADCFANDLPASEAAVLAATQLPIAASALSEKSSAPAWTTIPSWALIGTADHVIPPAEQLFMARRANAHIVMVNASHMSMISHPTAVTDLILAAAQANLFIGENDHGYRPTRRWPVHSAHPRPVAHRPQLGALGPAVLRSGLSRDRQELARHGR